jgi:hypothetical protein
MSSRLSKTHARLAALLLGVAMLPAYGGGRTPAADSAPAFGDFDTNKDNYLSLDEFKAQGKDELAFKAADINGDQQVDREEFARYQAKKASDQTKSDSDAGEKAKPASGY